MNLSDRDLEKLSAYLDGEISRKDRERLEARLLEDEDFRNAHEELQHTRQVMRSLSSMRAPRNYFVNAEMVGQKETVSRAFPVLRFASVLASVLFVLLFLGDILVPRSGVVSTLKAVQVAETIIEEAEAPVAEAPQIESELPEAQAGEVAPAREEAVESAAAEAPQLESDLPEAQEDRAMEMAPTEGEAAAPLPEPTPGSPSEPAAELERMVTTGIPAPIEESEEAVGGEEESFAAPNLLEEGGVIDIPLEEQLQQTINLWTVVRFLEIFLIVVALTTGLVALLLFRRNKIIP